MKLPPSPFYATLQSDAQSTAEPQKAARSAKHHQPVTRTRLALITALICVASVALIRQVAADLGDIYSDSMEPTIIQGDRVFVNKLAYGLNLPFQERPFWEWSMPERGEIVVFRSPVGGRFMIKRVVGIPGDVVRMAENQLYINGERVAYTGNAVLQIPAGSLRSSSGSIRIEAEYLGESAHPIQLSAQGTTPDSFEEVVVSEGTYLVLGDNRDLSVDSRLFGLISEDQILGRVNRIAVSLDPEAGFSPRWERFLHPLT